MIISVAIMAGLFIWLVGRWWFGVSKKKSPYQSHRGYSRNSVVLTSKIISNLTHRYASNKFAFGVLITELYVGIICSDGKLRGAKFPLSEIADIEWNETDWLKNGPHVVISHKKSGEPATQSNWFPLDAAAVSAMPALVDSVRKLLAERKGAL